MTRKVFILSILLAGGFSFIHAQTQVLTLDEVFRLADENSKSISIHSLMTDEAEKAIEIAKNDLLPSVGAKATAQYISDCVTFDRDFGNWESGEMPHFGNSLILKATQVIYAGGRIKNNINLKRLEKESSVQDEILNRQDLRFLLAGYYLEISKLSNQKYVYENNISQTKLLVKDMQAAYKQGTALKSDITRYELQLQNLELGLTSVKNRINVMSYKLASTIGLDPGIKIMTDTASLLKLPVETKSQELWLNNKEEIPMMKKADLNIKMSENKIKSIKGEYLPDIRFAVTGEMTGPILIEVPPIDINFAYWFAGIEISYNLDVLFKGKKKMRQARINRQKMIVEKEYAEEELENSVHEACIGLDEAYTRMQTRLKSVQLAHENYNIVRQRYLNGLSLITDMLDAGNTQLDTELQLANDRINIIYQYLLLKKITGTL
ncbi:TolC family protein [Bacteroides caecigallinarum]|uniref:TolC family protein n=1 Tax=Bacteroides caecigallinarum TaxID=1411144 RepID=UPI00195D47BE|nr:TolC family protein [Bacteroides caecigallinarum]MBM6864214.1 TolC family protein [Bacteroides caecigallinarum]